MKAKQKQIEELLEGVIKSDSCIYCASLVYEALTLLRQAKDKTCETCGGSGKKLIHLKPHAYITRGGIPRQKTIPCPICKGTGKQTVEIDKQSGKAESDFVREFEKLLEQPFRIEQALKQKGDKWQVE